MLLTKITPGVGLLWFVVRREWRNLAIALGGTALVVAVSFAIMPEAWFQWAEVLSRVAGRDGTWAAVPIPFVVRVPFAVAIVVWGAWTGRRWTVPVAGMLALPALWYGGPGDAAGGHRPARSRGAGTADHVAGADVRGSRGLRRGGRCPGPAGGAVSLAIRASPDRTARFLSPIRASRHRRPPWAVRGDPGPRASDVRTVGRNRTQESPGANLATRLSQGICRMNSSASCSSAKAIRKIVSWETRR